MTSGIRAWREIQMSRETTQGTGTTDWTNWRGMGTIEDTRETVFPEEDVGIFGGVDRNYFPKVGAELVFDEVEATFEQLYHILDAGLYSSTGTTDTGSGIIRTYTLPETSSDIKTSTDLQTFNFLGGDNLEAEVFDFGFVSDISLSHKYGEALKVSATWTGREVTTDADGLVAGLSLTTVEEILSSKGTLFIDATSTDHGTSQISGTLLDADLSIDTGWQPIPVGDGRLDYTELKQVRPELMLSLVFEHDSNSITEKTAWRGKTARLIQLKWEGTALSSSGTYTYKTLIVNLTGKYEDFAKIGERDGNDILECTFRTRYNATSATYASIILVNEVA